MRAPLREPAMIRICEEAVDLGRKRLVRLLRLVGPAARLREELAVAREAREPEVREPRLTRSEELALAAKLEVDLRELEAVGRSDERLESGLSRLGELVARARDEQAVRLVAAASDTATQLVELGEP